MKPVPEWRAWPCEQPPETGEDGKATLEIIFAAYESAGTGRKVALPFVPPEGLRPIELWLRQS